MKKILLGVTILLGSVLFLPSKSHAAVSLPIYTISGSVFQDNDRNGSFDLSKMDFGLKNESVTLYNTLDNAKNNTGALKSVKTNSLGSYSFSSLKQGEYYLKYNPEQTNYQAVPLAQNPINQQNQKIATIVPVVMKKNQLLYNQNLPLRRLTKIAVTPFNDHNWNGLRDENEDISNGKTMIVLDLKRFAEAYQNGTLATLDSANILSSGLTTGNVDLLDGLYLRTTKNNEAIQFSDINSGTYVMIRSPFNLTIGDTLNNATRIQAILTILQNGDLNALLNNPELLITNDIDTNNDNVYLKKLATLFQQLALETNKINIDAVLNSNGTQLSSSISKQLGQITALLNAVPAYRLGVITYFGDSYDITGLKIKKTNDFLFGIKNYATISGSVFSDLDNDGKKGALELSGANAKVSVYDTQGNELGSATTTSLNSFYKLAMLPYDTALYLAIETDRPTSPLLAKNQLPLALQDKKIVAQYSISKYAVESVVTQNIGVMSSVPTSVSMSLKEFDLNQLKAKITFANTDKLRTATVFYRLNDGQEQSINLDRAPLLGSAKPKEVIFAPTLPQGQNNLKAYWKIGVYQVTLADLNF